MQLPAILHSTTVFQSYQCTACYHLTEHTPQGAFLFNQKVYLQYQPLSHLFSFRLDFLPENQLVALIHIFIYDERALSPYRATFGGIECLTIVPELVLGIFISEVEAILRQHGVTTLQLTSMPQGYQPSTMHPLTQLLHQHHYTTAVQDINYHISLTHSPLLSRMHPSERRRMRKCQQAGMWFTELPPTDLTVVYDFICKARLRKHFPMTLSYEDFVLLFERMPQVYRIFAVYHAGNLAALTVTVRLSASVLYNFYPADNEAYASYSPTVFLIANLYEKAYQEGYEVLDLGIATDKGLPNTGLMRFKKNLGAEPSPRITFRKHLF